MPGFAGRPAERTDKSPGSDLCCIDGSGTDGSGTKGAGTKGAGTGGSDMSAFDVSATVVGPDSNRTLLKVSRHVERAEAGTGDELVVITAAGDIDLYTVSLLRMALAEAVAVHRRVCCDLRDAAFLGATGVNALVAARKQATDGGHEFWIRGVHGLAGAVLRITGLEEILTHP